MGRGTRALPRKQRGIARHSIILISPQPIGGAWEGEGGGMKKIINEKIYNTDTAELIADEGRSLHNFYCTSESLYVTKSGQWFLRGESSAGGKYGSVSEGGRSWGSGEDIILLSPAEVAAWAENAEINDKEKSLIAEKLGLQEG